MTFATVNTVSHNILAIQSGRYGPCVENKVAENWLDHCSQRVVITALKFSLLLSTGDFFEGLNLELIVFSILISDLDNGI